MKTDNLNCIPIKGCSFFMHFSKVREIYQYYEEESIMGNQQIAGASFSLYPMSDDFVAIIQKSLSETDTSKVWMQTDDVTTTVRGKVVHVFDVTKAIMIHAAKTGKHVAFQATYSLGCPGDSEGDVYRSEERRVGKEGRCGGGGEEVSEKNK